MTSLRQALEQNFIIAPGAYDALTAKIAAQQGAEAVYMTGFGVAGSLLGVPDIGLVSATEMMDRARAMAASCAPVPLIADGDNGFGGVANVERLVKAYEQAGISAIQLEDQVLPKRCGHMEGKQVISKTEAVQKIKAAVDARNSNEFLIIARTDARADNGLEDALDRALAYKAAGADILFVEAPQSIEEMQTIAERLSGATLVANLVEDGKTPMLPPAKLAAMGFRLILYPITALLTAAHATAHAYRQVLRTFEVPVLPDRLRFDEYNDVVGLSAYLRPTGT